MNAFKNRLRFRLAIMSSYIKGSPNIYTKDLRVVGKTSWLIKQAYRNDGIIVAPTQSQRNHILYQSYDLGMPINLDRILTPSLICNKYRGRYFSTNKHTPVYIDEGITPKQLRDILKVLPVMKCKAKGIIVTDYKRRP